MEAGRAGPPSQDAVGCVRVGSRDLVAHTWQGVLESLLQPPAHVGSPGCSVSIPLCAVSGCQASAA